MGGLVGNVEGGGLGPKVMRPQGVLYITLHGLKR